MKEHGMTEDQVRQALQTMIAFFESGTKESDAIAKRILLSDADYWREVIARFQAGSEWTGIRAPEAELLVLALRQLGCLSRPTPEKLTNKP